MHKYNKIIISCAATILALCSCSSGDEYNRNATGKITLDVETDKTITQSVVSRATTPSMPVLNSLTPDKLTLSLTNKSGTYSHTWSSHNEFPEEEEFPADTYTMTASYGNTDAEGFESPQLYGEVSFPVVAGKVTPVKLTATVANSLIMFEPTEKFLNYFQSARFVLNTAAGNSLVVNPGETRPVYINPGNARIDARVVMPSGTDALITIGYFTAKKATLHRIALDVDASTGTATLTIRFDETFPDVEPITIDLTKDLESLVPLPIPVITPEGFEGSRAVDLRETYSDDYAFNIATRAGLASATLSVADDGDEPEVYNLLDDKDAAALANKGLRTLNLKPGCEFSKIYLKDFVASLRCKSRDTDSSKAITICVKDSLGHTTDETLADNNTFKVNLSPVTFSIEAVKDVIVHPTYQIKVTYNGRDIEKWMKFNIISKTGTKSDTNPVKIEPGTTEDEYLCTFNTPIKLNQDQSNDYSKFKVESEFTENVNSVADILIPEYQVVIDIDDVWTKKAAFYIAPRSGNEEYLSDILDNLTISGKGSEHIKSREGANTVFDITDLNPATKYNLTFSLNNYNPTTKEFTTEEELQLPNSNMEDWNSLKINTYQWEWIVGDGTIWSSLNKRTVSNSYGTFPYAYNATSGTIPANARSNDSHTNGSLLGSKDHASGHTLGENNTVSGNEHSGKNAALIRTVGYAKSKDLSDQNTASTKSGSMGNCRAVSAGELYLGSYNSGPQYGYGFTSRPSSLSFYYKYITATPNNGDYGTATITVLDFNGTEIASSTIELKEKASYYPITVSLKYPSPAKKAHSIQVIFRSSGLKDLDEKINTTFLIPPGAYNLGGGEYVGSELYIDDIQLNYD